MSNKDDGSPPDVVMAEPDRGTLSEYQPNKALVRAVEDWLPEFYKPKSIHETPKKKKEGWCIFHIPKILPILG